jgi:hypothetical protein
MGCQAYNRAQVVSGCGVGVGKFADMAEIVHRSAQALLEWAGVGLGIGGPAQGTTGAF